MGHFKRLIGSLLIGGIAVCLVPPIVYVADFIITYYRDPTGQIIGAATLTGVTVGVYIYDYMKSSE